MEVKSILLIEDDELDVISVERSLKKIDLNYRLHTAYNGVEALEKLYGHDGEKILPDLILLDINMPRMTGIEFLTKLKSDPTFDHIKVYVMTTSNDHKDQQSMEGLGVHGYILKPMNFTDNTKKHESMDYFMHFQIRKILNE